MRKLGLIGGMSWIATRTYYERINKLVQKAVGAQSSAPMLIESLDYAPLYGISDEAEWDHAAATIGDSAERLEQAGAEGLVLCSNAKHRIYERIAERVSIPILDVADIVGKKMAEAGIKRASLLGTRTVMSGNFYRRKLVAAGIDLLAPEASDIDTLDRIIFDELMIGKVRRDAERTLKTIITQQEQAGAEAIVLGCTELELVVDDDANVLPIFNSGALHCQAAAEWILAKN